MSDEPTGQYVSRQIGMGVTAKKYHLYDDCSLLLGGRGRSSSDNFEVVDVDERIIDLMALTPCSTCKNRSESVSALDVVAEGVKEILLSTGGPAGPLVTDAAADVGAQALIDRLEKYGYRIRAVRSRNAP